MKGTCSKKNPPPTTAWDIEDSTRAPSAQVEHAMDKILQHILTNVLGESNSDVLCLTVNQNFGCINDIMSCNLKLFKELTLIPPNASTPVKMVDQPRLKDDACLL